MAADELTAPPVEEEADTGSLDLGSILNDRYEIQSVAGVGCLGTVYRAQDKESGEPVAIRQVHPDLTADPELRASLEEQLRAAAGLEHKNIVEVRAVFQHDDGLYASLELVDGQSLRQLIGKKRSAGTAFSLKGAYNVLAHLCNALEHAHGQEAPLVHGLPGPGSVFVNETGRVKLSDFGLLGAITTCSSNGAALTDGGCLAPELQAVAGEPNPSADIYALGGVLHMLLTGEAPAGPGACPAALEPELPAEVDRVVERCLHQVPEQRFENPAALKAAFYAAIGDAATADPVTTIDEEELQDLEEDTPAPVPPGIPAELPPPIQPGPPLPAVPPPPVQQQPPAPQLAGQIPVMPGRQQQSVEDLLAVEDPDQSERWLVQKDRLDFGPFAMAELKRQINQGQFGGDDSIKDQETGKTSRIRNHPQLREFIILVERETSAKQVEKQEMQKWEQEKRRRTATVLVVAFCLLALGVGGAFAAYYLTKDPETREKIVYRDRTDEALKKLIASMEITFKTQAPAQKKKKRRYKRRKVKKPGEAGQAGTEMIDGQEVTYLGDATEAGGDARLSEDVVQRVMQQNFRKLVPCVYGQLKRAGGVKRVDIDFGIRGTGRVANARVNGKTSGPFHACILGKMKLIKFPEFAGSLTPASFYMTLK